MCFLELPNNFEELLSTKVVSSFACLLEQFLFSNGLSGNPSMIGTGDKEGLIAAHAFIPNQCILNGDCEGVANVKISCYVGRRKTNGKLLWVCGLVVGMEKLAALIEGYFCSHHAFQCLSTAVGL